MSILRKIIMGCGILFVVLVVIFSIAMIGSSYFKEKQEPFIVAFVQDLSADWTIKNVYARLTNSFIEQANSLEGRKALGDFSALGNLETIYDLNLDNFLITFSEKRGIFTFKATFQRSEALVKITLVEKDGVVQVESLNITPTEPLIGSAPAETEI